MWKKRIEFIGSLLKKVTLWFLAISICSVILFRFVPVPITPLMVIRCVQQKANNKPVILKKEWAPLEHISNAMQLAVVCAEDQNFLKHNGFDFGAIEKAMEHNKSNRRKRGASTISQQTAKNVFLWPQRSWIRKIFEVYFTFLIELLWDKERIMEVYLNVAEMGNGVYGAEAASQLYFYKSAKSLTPAESALIAAALPNPRKYKVKKPGGYVQKRQVWIIQQMNFWGGRLDYNVEEKEN